VLLSESAPGALSAPAPVKQQAASAAVKPGQLKRAGHRRFVKEDVCMAVILLFGFILPEIRI
jgi:hypothetical protein